MVYTLELRWFLEGPIPPDVETWFARKDPRDEGKRTDTYLLNDRKGGPYREKDLSEVGVKLREKKLQFKWRVSREAFSGLDGRVTGVAEGWKKWSRKYLEKSEKIVDEVFREESNTSCLRIEKHRRACEFSIDARIGKWALSREKHLEEGIRVELTKVDSLARDNASPRSSWTIGLDVYANQNEGDMLQQGFEHVFSDYPTSNELLVRENSYSYPQFVARELSRQNIIMLDG